MPAQPKPEKDEPVQISVDPEEALRALLAVKPDDPATSPSGDGETAGGTRPE